MQNNTVTIRKDVIIGILLGVIVLLVGYIILRDQFRSDAVVIAPTNQTTNQEPVGETPTTDTPAFSIASDGPNIKKFTWTAKGLSFSYSPFVYQETEEYFGPDLSTPIQDPSVDVAGRLVFPRGSLEVFDKIATDTPERAVRTQFLNGENNTPTCTVKRVYAEDDDDFVYLPIPGVTFVRMKGSGCPELYRSDGSVSAGFFVLDSMPDKLFFVTTSDGENVALRSPSGVPFFASFAKITPTETQ